MRIHPVYMFQTFKGFAYFLCGIIFLLALTAETGMLVFDSEPERTRPKRFRAIPALGISGSAQFSEESLQTILKEAKGNVSIIDLRRESHGFVNGMPISWYYFQNKSNIGLSTEAVLAREEAALASLRSHNTIDIHMIQRKQSGKILKTKIVQITPYQIESEAQLSQRLHLGYIRLPVTDHHRPEDSVVDVFVLHVKNQPAGSWWHFHCRGGAGRTTTFMTMYDFLKNAKTESIETIMTRQRQAGGTDVWQAHFDQEDQWKQGASEERKAFLESFYEYAASAKGYPTVSWQEWLLQRT